MGGPWILMSGEEMRSSSELAGISPCALAGKSGPIQGRDRVWIVVSEELWSARVFAVPPSLKWPPYAHERVMTSNGIE